MKSVVTVLLLISLGSSAARETKGFQDPNCVIDLGVVLDASGSVRDDWSLLLAFVASLTESVNPGPGGSHIGVVKFGDDAEKIFDFREFDESTYAEADVLQKITDIGRPGPGERTFINRGLKLANRQLFREEFGMRPEVKQVALLITDGKQTSYSSQTEPSPVRVANAMKMRGIEIIALGIAQDDPVELSLYASSPNYILYVPNFSQLDAKVLETAEILCPTPTTTAPPTTTPLPTTTPPPTTTTAPPTTTTAPPTTTTAPPTTTTAPPTTTTAPPTTTTAPPTTTTAPSTTTAPPTTPTLIQIVGPPGDPGPKGDKGDQGPPGPPGLQGDRGQE